MTGPELLTLAIETSNPSADAAEGEGEGETSGPGVALGVCGPGGGARVLARAPLRARGRHDDGLMMAIDGVCRDAGVGAREIRRVAVSVGPGGYTGLRVAVATAKMIAEAAGGVCIAVPTAVAVALRLAADDRAAGAAVALASKGGSAWIAAFPAGWSGPAAVVPEGRVVDSAGAAGLFLGVKTAVLAADRFLPAGIRDAAERAGVRVARPRFDAAAVLEASCGLPEVDPAALAPLYPREPDAVTLWRERRGGAGTR